MVNNTELANYVQGMENRINILQSDIEGEMEELRKEMSRMEAMQSVQDVGHIVSLEGTVSELKGTMMSLNEGMTKKPQLLESLDQPPGRPPE